MLYLLFKKSLAGNFFTDLLEVFIKLQDIFRIAAVDPVACKRQKQLDAIGIGGVGDLSAVKFYLMNRRVDKVAVDSLLHQVLQHRHDDALDLPGIGFSHILQTAGKQAYPGCLHQIRYHPRGLFPVPSPSGLFSRVRRNCRAKSAPAI